MKDDETTTKGDGAPPSTPSRGRLVRTGLAASILAGIAIAVFVARHDFRPEAVKNEEAAKRIETLIAAGRGEEARSLTPELLERSEAKDDLRLRFGRAYLRHGDLGPAVALLAPVEPKLIPEEKLAIAEYFLGSGDPFSASRFFEAASRDLTPSPQLLARHGESLALAGQGEAAVALFRRSIEKDGKIARTHLHLAMTLANLGRLDESAKEANVALKLDPKDAKAIELVHALKTAR